MSSFDRLLRLAQKTGDRLIVHDSATNRSTVLLSLDEYERLWDQAEAFAISDESSFYFGGKEDPLDEIEDEEMENPWESKDESPWHSVDKVIEEQYPMRETPGSPLDTGKEQKQDTPISRVEQTQEGLSWKEEPIEDELLFFEEPL